MKFQSIKLLIIENSPDNWSDYEKESLLWSVPFCISVAGSIKEARFLLRKANFQTVFADYHLKDGICTDLIPDLKKIPLIVMAEEGKEDTTLMALKSGAIDYLIKDTRGNYKKMLQLAVNKSIEQRKQAQELEKYRNQLENIVEERTVELIDMYSKLQESETNFRNIFKSSNDGIIIISYEYDFIEANDAVLRHLGVNKEFLREHVVMDYIMPDFRPFLFQQLELVKKGIPSGIMELEIISPKDGSLLNFEVSSVPIVFNQKNAILSIMRDIGERKNHARKLFETVVQTEEDERNRIARDLHDEIGPLISALKIFINSFIEASEQAKKDKLAAQMGIIVREVIDSIKIISNDMSPHVLVNFGILAATQNFINLFSRNISVKLTSNIDNIRFPKTVESLIYRIIKELINNTVKHAFASGVKLDLTYNNKILTCIYSDDGIGFNWKKQLESPARGMGLHNIITRINSLGGNFDVDESSRKGFHIRFELQTITRNDRSNKEI
jgi:PAS domain S-box-containing protein